MPGTTAIGHDLLLAMAQSQALAGAEAAGVNNVHFGAGALAAAFACFGNIPADPTFQTRSFGGKPEDPPAFGSTSSVVYLAVPCVTHLSVHLGS